ncbi:MAG: cupin-like domain-containing protein [Sphingomicrobium sp.]
MRPIAEFELMDRERFEHEVVPKGEPALFRGLAADWPLVHAGKDGPEALAQMLHAAATDEPFQAWFAPPEIEGRFNYNADFSGFNFERRLATVDQLLDLLLRQLGHDKPYSMYAGGIPIRRHLPALIPDIPVAMLDMARDTLISLWLGNRTHTATHWDQSQNLACVVAGRRRFTLFPPEQLRNLYVGPLDHTLAGQPISLVDIDTPDLEAYPRFREALETARRAELGPGDALYIPSLWWHDVLSLENFGSLINFWWRDAEPPLLTPLHALFHAAITIRDLPPNELAAWRGMFDHYIFGDNGDPVAHLPEPARGILGSRSPALVARVKKLLIDALSG